MIEIGQLAAMARECGFELAGVARAEPLGEAAWYHRWVEAGFAGSMHYLTDHRANLRDDPRNLLPSARSVVCVGKLYNGPEPRTSEMNDPARAWISRYAWGDDYHDILRRGLEALATRMRAHVPTGFDYRICVDTAPLLERALAYHAGLGWLGRNGCIIREGAGSWFFLGEMLVSLDLAPGTPAPDRCGTCTRCIDACPTRAIVPVAAGPLTAGQAAVDSSGNLNAPPRGPGAQIVSGGLSPGFTVDSRLCISYLTIELRGPYTAEQGTGIGQHIFGCDICQDVCPWNGSAPVTAEGAFAARQVAPPLERLSQISELEFMAMFRHSPVRRARYTGFLRNVAAAMGNAGLVRFRAPLERLAAFPDTAVAGAAREALQRLDVRAASPQELQEQHEAGKYNQDGLSGHTSH